MKFAGNKPIAMILAQARADQLAINDAHYNRGGDFISFRSGNAVVFYNAFDGQFWGFTDKGVEFDSQRDTHAAEPWFQALLAYFYTEDVGLTVMVTPALGDSFYVLGAGGYKARRASIARSL